MVNQLLIVGRERKRNIFIISTILLHSNSKGLCWISDVNTVCLNHQYTCACTWNFRQEQILLFKSVSIKEF